MLPTKEDKSVESFDVRVVEETGSTNDDMKTHARSSRVSRPLVLEAKHQPMGRGTRGRGWKSPEGCLAFSLLLPFSMIRVPVSLVAIAVGMGVCSALRDAGRFACIKWPNDVWFEGGKCGGILCESVKDADGRSVLIAGVVLACSDHAAPNPMLGPLVTGILGILTRDRADVAAAWPFYDAFAGRTIRLEDDGGAWKGLNMGIDSLGRLQLKTNEGVKAFFSGTFFNDDAAY